MLWQVSGPFKERNVSTFTMNTRAFSKMHHPISAHSPKLYCPSCAFYVLPRAHITVLSAKKAKLCAHAPIDPPYPATRRKGYPYAWEKAVHIQNRLTLQSSSFVGMILKSWISSFHILAGVLYCIEILLELQALDAASRCDPMQELSVLLLWNLDELRDWKWGYLLRNFFQLRRKHPTMVDRSNWWMSYFFPRSIRKHQEPRDFSWNLSTVRVGQTNPQKNNRYFRGIISVRH